MNTSDHDRQQMSIALNLARRGMGITSPNPPVGAVICRGKSAISTGYHRKAGRPHAEIYALRNAGHRARGATMYVTLEPCSTTGLTGACTDAIVAASPDRIVISTRDPNPAHRGRGISLLRAAGIEVAEGVCESRGKSMVAPFAKHVSSGVPYTTLKLGTTLDGRIADHRGGSRWITSAASRNIVHDMRRRVDAVLVGSGTAKADNPRLLPESGPRPGQVRIVADTTGSLSVRSRIFTDGHQDRTIIATTKRCPARQVTRYEKTGARVWILPQSGDAVSMRSLYRRMGREGIVHVLCEGGGGLASSLIDNSLLDEMVVFQAPRLLGGGGKPSVGGSGWSLARAPQLSLASCARIGPDIMIHAFCNNTTGPSAILGERQCSQDS